MDAFYASVEQCDNPESGAVPSLSATAPSRVSSPLRGARVWRSLGLAVDHGHAAAAPPRCVMNCRRLMLAPRGQNKTSESLKAAFWKASGSGGVDRAGTGLNLHRFVWTMKVPRPPPPAP
jgi:hypothetical protein